MAMGHGSRKMAHFHLWAPIINTVKSLEWRPGLRHGRHSSKALKFTPNSTPPNPTKRTLRVSAKSKTLPPWPTRSRATDSLSHRVLSCYCYVQGRSQKFVSGYKFFGGGIKLQYLYSIAVLASFLPHTKCT